MCLCKDCQSSTDNASFSKHSLPLTNVGAGCLQTGGKIAYAKKVKRLHIEECCALRDIVNGHQLRTVPKVRVAESSAELGALFDPDSLRKQERRNIESRL